MSTAPDNKPNNPAAHHVGGATGPDARSVALALLRPASRAETAFWIIIGLLVWAFVFALGSAVNRRAEFLPDGSLFAAAHGDTLAPSAVSGSPSPAGLPRERGGGCVADQGGEDAVAAAAPAVERWRTLKANQGVMKNFTIIPTPAQARAASDPFVLCALRALDGQYGPLAAWQRNAYRRGLVKRHTLTAWQTCYGPWEAPPSDSKWDCRGGFCTESTAAANLKHLPYGTVIWISRPSHLRVIRDTGASYNDKLATLPRGQYLTIRGRRLEGKGTDAWIDLWTPYLGWNGLRNDCYIVPIAVID